MDGLPREGACQPVSSPHRIAYQRDESGRLLGSSSRSTEKARRELGFEAAVSLREGMAQTVEWTRENIELIDACIARHADQMAAASAPVDELVAH